MEVIDARASRYWTVGIEGQGLRDGGAVVAIAPWTKDPLRYYDTLSDGDAGARATVDAYRILMDREFDGSATFAAIDAALPGWVCCPVCRWLWHMPVQPSRIDCPNCCATLRNPELEVKDEPL